MNNLGLIIQDGKVIVSSRDVAEVYKKQHKHVMDKIRNFIEVVPELNGSNFRLVEYIDEKGEKRPEYVMDRQGFSILVNKFTGTEALKFTIKYTEAFEEMTRQIQLGEFKPKATSIGEIASLLKILRVSMKEQGSQPSEITEMEEMICQQFNVRLPKNFIRKPAFMQISLTIPLEQ